MEKDFNNTLANAKSRLQRGVFEISSRIKSMAHIITVENESTESKKAFYLFSITLLISLILLSPDKILQILTSSQTDSGIIEKLQEGAKIIKKLMPNLG